MTGDDRAKVAVFAGSVSDEDVVKSCLGVLDQLKIPYVFYVASAHRSPNFLAAKVARLESLGVVQVYICVAGLAAHLAGAVAAKTVKPVIGIPKSASALGGMDALLSTVQMPPGIPVATVALDKAGARNAGFLAAQILGLKYSAYRTSLEELRVKDEAAIEKLAATAGVCKPSKPSKASPIKKELKGAKLKLNRMKLQSLLTQLVYGMHNRGQFTTKDMFFRAQEQMPELEWNEQTRKHVSRELILMADAGILTRPSNGKYKLATNLSGRPEVVLRKSRNRSED